MATADGHGRGLRFALRSHFGRASRRVPDGLARSVAAPDLSWDDADHDASQIEEDHVFDPWETESRTKPAPEPPSAGIATEGSGSHSPVPTSEASAVLEQSNCAHGDAKSPTNAPPNAAASDCEERQDQREEWQATGSQYEAGSGEDWDALEDAEEDLEELRDEIGALKDSEPIDDGRGTFVDDLVEQLGPAAEQGLTEAAKPIEWTEIADEALDADWADETDWADGFETFEIERDHDTRHDELGLFDYDERARRSPWDLKPDDEETAIRRARAKAATIASLLDVTSRAEQDVALRYLTDLFEHLRHPSTYRAIQKLAAEGLDLETLWATVELRRVWMQRTDWWLIRRQGDVCLLQHGAPALTWVLAHRVCLARPDFSPDTMIDDEWLDEWLTLPSGATGYFSFPAFIAEKVDSLQSEALDAGLHMGERSGRGDFGDDYAWYRRVSDRHNAIRLGFHILTPYDDRPGVIRPGPPQDDKESPEA